MFKVKAFVIGLYLMLGSIAVGFGMNTPEPSVPKKIIGCEVEKVEIVEVVQTASIVEVCEMDTVTVTEPPIEAIAVSVEEELPLSDEEIDLIALIAMAEAEGESEEGKRLVIDTILNRVDHERFPDTVKEVIYQKNQFSCITDGRVERCYVQEEIVELVKEELIDRTNDEVMFFRSGKYSKYGEPLFVEGNHYFSSYA